MPGTPCTGTPSTSDDEVQESERLPRFVGGRVMVLSKVFQVLNSGSPCLSEEPFGK